MVQKLKVVLLIADSDKHYLQGFCRYIKKYARDQFNVIALNNETEIRSYLEQSQSKLDLVVTSLRFIEIFKSLEETIPVILLNSEREPEYSGKNPTIDKFQSGEALLNEITDIYSGCWNYKRSPKERIGSAKASGCITMCVYSPQGGAGKTTISVSLANQLGLMGYSIFYLNLESVCSTGSFFDISSKYNFSHIIYYLRSNRDSLSYKLRCIRKTDVTGKVSYFPQPSNPLEMEDLTAEDVSFLIKTIKDTAEYDFIIIDMSSDWNRVNAAVMENSDLKLILVNEDPIMQKKIGIVMESIKNTQNNVKSLEDGQMMVIRNRSRNEKNNENMLTNTNIPVRFNIPDFQNLASETDCYIAVNFNLHFNHQISLLGKEILEWRNCTQLYGS